MPTPSGLPDQELGPEEGRRPAWWRRLIAWGLRQGANAGRGLRRVRDNRRAQRGG
jgi:hypothetical protein